MHRVGSISCAAIAAGIAVGAAHTTAEPQAPVYSQGSAAEQAAKDNAPQAPSAKSEAEAEIDLAKLRLREGTRLHDVSGRFRQNGDSLTFIDGENREIGGLPNLNLERIIRMLKTVEEPESITWSISGTVTEFSGRNYLLISRAVFKAATPPPAPEALAK
jgi:hypothetical protein